MEDKKRVIILVSIALILAATAITLNVMDSDEIPTTGAVIQEPSPGQIGIEILPSPIEDKLAQAEQEAQA